MILSYFERLIATRYLGSKRKEVFISIITVISVVGVALSVMVLNAVLAIMTGFQEELRDKLVGANAHVVVRSLRGPFVEWADVESKIKTVSGVKAVFPYTHNQAMLMGNQTARGILIRGVANNAEAYAKLQTYTKGMEGIASALKPASIDIIRPDGSRDSVTLPPLIIGRELAMAFGLEPGEAVTLLSPNVTSSPQGMVPQQRRFVVTAIYQSGLVEYESALVYTNLQSAQAFFDLGQSVTGLEAIVADLEKAPEIAAAMRAQVANYFDIKDWTKTNEAFWRALKLERRVYFIVLLLLILIASFSIVSTLVMVVLEKGRDIAILKTIGATDRSVLKIFLFQGATIGAVGTILGTVAGYLFCIGFREYGFELDESVFSLSTVPVRLVTSNFLSVGIMAFIISSLAGVYPALRAAKIRPAEMLRYE
ncbi:FtsX-like permease family protein [bacterium]|nr:FtsX-like permease family protein [bacterium]